jgi:LacI family transcriptional regulator
VDGAITMTGSTGIEPVLDQLSRIPGFGSRPIANLIRPRSRGKSVLADEAQGTYESFQHLLALGHRHIMMMTLQPMELPILQRRFDGASRAFEEWRLDPATHLHLYPISSSFSWLVTPSFANLSQMNADTPLDYADRTFLSYLQEHPEVTAIAGFNDPSALYAWSALQHAGFRVPDDYSIIGYDDVVPLYDAAGTNLLTSVRVPLFDIGQEGARAIFHLMTDTSSSTDPVLLPTELVVRHSTGPVPER